LLSLYKQEKALSKQDITAIIDYNDNEGSIGERNNTEEKIAADKIWKSYYKSIVRTTMQPDPNITFPDKQLLYRKERPKSVTINMTFLIRAAAILILIACGIWMSIQFNRDKTVVKDIRKEQIYKTGNNQAAVIQKDTATLTSNETEDPRPSSIQHPVTFGKGFNPNETSSLIENDKGTTNTVIDEEAEEIADVEMIQIEDPVYTSTEPPIVNTRQNQQPQLPEQVYLMSSSEINEHPNKIQQVFKQVKRTFNRRLNHIIRDEPLRISIIQIKNK